jgi:predicted HicB family RNase H-like nuclease
MKNKENENRRVTFQIPDELYEGIVTAAARDDRSVSSFIRQSLVNAVQNDR